MNEKDAGQIVAGLELNELIVLSKAINQERAKWIKKLERSISKEFNFGEDEILNLIIKGECYITLEASYNLTMDRKQKKEMIARWRKKIEPITRSWAQYGISLEVINFSQRHLHVAIVAFFRQKRR